MPKHMALLILLMSGLTACSRSSSSSPTEPGGMISGSGVLVTESRSVSGFDSVRLNVAGDLILEQTGSESLSITTDDNIIGQLTSEVVGGQLVLGTSTGASISPSQPILYQLTVGEIGELIVSGAANIEASGIQTDRFVFILSGAGSIAISGEVNRQVLTISGAGRYDATNLVSEVALITISGAGHATVRASRRIEGEISGSGILEYYGDPEIQVTVSGTGTVQRLGD